LRKLEKTGASDKVRAKAAGALWILEDRAKQLPKPTPGKTLINNNNK